MKALVLKEYNNFSYTDVPDPQFNADEVIVHIKACGICGSDVHGMDGSSGSRIPPIIMGHEASGVIADVGSAVAFYKSGDRVTFDSTIYCTTCEFCKRGEYNLCDKRRFLGVSCAEYRQQGAFAEYIVVPQHIVHKLPDSVTFEQAAMIEPCTNAMHAVNRSRISARNTVVVVGVGITGLFVIQILKTMCGPNLVAIDGDELRLSLAKNYGADIALNSNIHDIEKEILALTDGKGADIAFEVACSASTIHTANYSLRKGGVLILIGNLSPFVKLPVQSIVTRELSILGSCASQGEYPICLSMIEKGVIKVDALLSAVAPLQEGAEWFNRLYHREKNLMKVMLVPR
jgi:L-iditol 2-dehydrogenase